MSDPAAVTTEVFWCEKHDAHANGYICWKREYGPRPMISYCRIVKKFLMSPVAARSWLSLREGDEATIRVIAKAIERTFEQKGARYQMVGPVSSWKAALAVIAAITEGRT